MFLFQMRRKHLTKAVCILMTEWMKLLRKIFFSINNEINIECQKRGRELKRIGENWKHGRHWPSRRWTSTGFPDMLKNIVTASFSRRCLNTWRRVVSCIWFNKSTTVENRQQQWLTYQHLDSQSALMRRCKRLEEHYSAKSWKRVATRVHNRSNVRRGAREKEGNESVQTALCCTNQNSKQE